MVRSGRGQVGAASSGVAPHRSGGRDGGGRAGSGGLLGLTVARLAVVGLDHLRGTGWSNNDRTEHRPLRRARRRTFGTGGGTARGCRQQNRRGPQVMVSGRRFLRAVVAVVSPVSGSGGILARFVVAVWMDG